MNGEQHSNFGRFKNSPMGTTLWSLGGENGEKQIENSVLKLLQTLVNFLER